MDLQNYKALQILPNFNLGMDDLFEGNNTSDDDIIVHLDSVEKENASNDTGHAGQVQQFLHESIAKSTIYKDVSAENRFRKFVHVLNPTDVRQIHQIPPSELDVILSKFFMTANKIDKNSIERLGELYQPDSLSAFVHSWQRILSSRGSKIDLKRDKDFETSRKVLAARRKRLVNQGMGNKPCTTRPLSNYEVDKLYNAGYFGTTSALSLQRNMWWVLTLSCGFRGRDESRKLKFGDIKLCFDQETKQNYLEWTVLRGSKTYSGENSSSHSQQRTFNPPIYETDGGDRCPVRIYQLFVSHRPQDSLTADSPFFLTMVPSDKISSAAWYYNRPLGKNKLGEFLSHTQSILGNSATSRSKISNHSARKTSITTLLNNDIHPLHVMQLSGHKNIESLNHYNIASKDQQRKMSNILNNAPTRDRSPLRISSANSSHSSTHQVSLASKDDSTIASLFSGATLRDNVININITQQLQQPRRKRYIIYDSDDE